MYLSEFRRVSSLCTSVLAAYPSIIRTGNFLAMLLTYQEDKMAYASYNSGQQCVLVDGGSPALYTCWYMRVLVGPSRVYWANLIAYIFLPHHLECERSVGAVDAATTSSRFRSLYGNIFTTPVSIIAHSVITYTAPFPANHPILI